MGQVFWRRLPKKLEADKGDKSLRNFQKISVVFYPKVLLPSMATEKSSTFLSHTDPSSPSTKTPRIPAKLSSAGSNVGELEEATIIIFLNNFVHSSRYILCT